VAEIVLFHSAVGRRPAVLRMAQRLSAAGHSVTTPDLYDGEVFDDVDAGVAHMRSIGWPELSRRAQAAVADLPSDLVVAGMSMGTGLAAEIAVSRPGVRGALLLYGGNLPDEPWPADCPVQVHHAVNDPWADEGAAAELIEAVARAGSAASWHLYPGSKHLLDDDDLPAEHDPAATALMWPRIEAFLNGL
jgi:dienelactone hydrolase